MLSSRSRGVAWFGLPALAVAALLLVPVALPQAKVGPPERPVFAFELDVEEPTAGKWRPWFLASPSDVLPPPPPGAAGTRHELELLRSAAASRSGASLEAARRWDEGPANLPWVDVHMGALGRHAPHPPLAARNLAVVDAAIYDAVIATWFAKFAYDRAGPWSHDPSLPAMAPRSAPSYPSEHAAVAGAASAVLAWLYPADAAEFAKLAREAAQSRVDAGLNFPSDVEAGLALGAAVARVAIAARTGDGAVEAGREYPLDLIPSGPDAPYGACSWKPTPTLLEGPWGVEMGSVRTFLLSPAQMDDVAAPPPLECDSAEYFAQHRAVYEQGFVDPEHRKEWALWWHDHAWAHPDGHVEASALAVAGTFAPLLRDWVKSDELSTPRSARAFALLHVSMSDTFISIWRSKYEWWSERPVTVVREHFGDGDWLPLLETPPFPGYPSGHSGQGGVAGEVLAYLFPERAVIARAWGYDDTRAREVAGVHPVFDDDEGREQGLRVAKIFIARARTDGADGTLPPGS